MYTVFVLTILFGLSHSQIRTSDNSNLLNGTVPTTLVAIGGTATIPLPQVAKYRRIIANEKEQYFDEQVFTVCTGKNKNACGFWKSTQTKKRVSAGATNYNKNKKALVVKKMGAKDFGIYMTMKGDQFRYVSEKVSSGK